MLTFLLLIIAIFLMIIAFYFTKKKEKLAKLFGKKNSITTVTNSITLFSRIYLGLGLIGIALVFVHNLTFTLIYIFIVLVCSMIFSFTLAKWL